MSDDTDASQEKGVEETALQVLIRTPVTSLGALSIITVCVNLLSNPILSF